MVFTFDRFVFDSDQRILRRGAEIVAVPPKALEVLEVFVASDGRVLGKQELMQRLWPDSFVEESNLTQNIFILRRALGHTAEGKPLIETLSKRGYRFTSSVLVQAVPPAKKMGQPPEQEQLDPGSDVKPIEKPKASVAAKTAARRWSRPGAVAVALLAVACACGLLWTNPRAPLHVGPIIRLTNDGRLKTLYPTYLEAPLVESGGELVFTEAVDGQNRIGRIAVTGSATATVPVPTAGDYVVGTGQRRGTLLLSSPWPGAPDSAMVEQSLNTGATREIRDVYGHDGSWSPDGKQLAYALNGELLIRTVENGGARLAPLARVDGRIFWPRWSPDGRRIRFSESFDGYQDEMWEVKADGSNLHLIFQEQKDRTHVCCGSWTRDGRAFVYLSVESSGSDIVIAPEPGTWWPRSARIPAAPLDVWGGPTPGSDGRHVYAMGEQLHGNLMRIDPATRRAEPYLGGISAEGVAFSTDRHWIAYTAYPEGTLWRSRIDGSERLQLTRAPLLSRFPRWSPDGKRILFLAAQAGSNWNLYTIAANGGDVKPLMQDGLGEGAGSWSPDGASVYFGRLLDYTHDGPGTLRVEQLHLPDGTITALPGSGGMWTARLSPDGRYLSAVSSDNQTLRLCDLATHTWTDAARMDVNDVAWSPDGRYLFFDENRGSEWLIYRLRVANGRLEEWADLHAFRRAGFFSPWLGVAPDGSPLLLEDASIQEIYAIPVNLP